MTQEHPGSSAQTRLVKLRIPGQNEHLLLVSEASTWQASETASGLYFPSGIRVEAWYVSGPIHGARWKGQGVAEFAGKTQWGDSVKLTNGFLLIEPPELRGHGLGSYLFAKVVGWAKQLAPNTAVELIHLNATQAEDVANRDRRNRLYEKCGFKFDYKAFEGSERAEGSSLPMTVADLIIPTPSTLTSTGQPSPVIEAVSLLSYLRDIHEKQVRLVSDLEGQRYRNTALEKEFTSANQRADAWRSRFVWCLVLWIAALFIWFWVAKG